jgi:tRNA modification GTPase
VVRVSGGELSEFAFSICGRDVTPRQATLASFKAADGSVIDQGLLLFFPGPNSFTGEDVIELQGHGGPVVMQMLLQRCLELGARIARPGEFSERAFLNDKLDLAQAEAIADLIDATTTGAVRSAQRSLSGEFSKAIHSLVEQLIELRMLVEATLDFPEEEIDVIRDTDASQRLQRLNIEIAALAARARQGSLLRTGLHVVLAGLPNVGKSSLLNRLAGEERAIVTELAGTTRDTLRETIQIEGIPLHVIDTAGLRDTEDKVEQLGIERTWKEIEKADMVLQLVDARTGETPADHAVGVKLPHKLPRIVIHNKCDLAGQAPKRYMENRQVHIWLSAKQDLGINLLHDELLRVAGWVGHGEDVILARERHLSAIAKATQFLTKAGEQLRQLELCAEELRQAQQSLSEITGEFTPDDLLGEIFSRFCIGK